MQFIGLLPFFSCVLTLQIPQMGLKGRWPRILFLTPASNLIVQLMFELNVLELCYFCRDQCFLIHWENIVKIYVIHRYF